jgi:hypothetical protein
MKVLPRKVLPSMRLPLFLSNQSWESGNLSNPLGNGDLNIFILVEVVLPTSLILSKAISSSFPGLIFSHEYCFWLCFTRWCV